MPTLILSSRYTTESKILRKAAEASQWQTLRLENDQVPAWYEDERGEARFREPAPPRSPGNWL